MKAAKAAWRRLVMAWRWRQVRRLAKSRLEALRLLGIP
jgi:hypothetical protein